MTDSETPGRQGGDSGDGSDESGLVRADAGERRVTLNAARVTLPVGIQVEQLRIRATGTALGWTLLVLAVSAALVSLAWLARTT